ncbi:dynamin family protein [Roseiflexus sp.]|uniref:dynamin family protein n=1 Tax=Roseiflexus sp. TaxID=2562120 RepID=UPI00398AC55B
MTSFITRRKLLTERQEALLEAIRAALEALRAALKRFGVDVAPNDARILNDVITNLDELFLLVVAGEYNSGKSSFINALLGAPVVAEGVTPTTDRITVLRYGDVPSETVRGALLVEHRFPADVVRHMAIVDTPGTNAIIKRHEELTRDFIPRADLVLFVTSASQPFSASERAFLELIRDWGKKVVIVVNKADLLDEAGLAEVVTFVGTHAEDLFGVRPEIFAISSRLARQARDSNDQALWDASRFPAIEQYISNTLDEEQRVRLKLLSPLGVAHRLAERYLVAIEDRLMSLRDDVAAIENIERQLAQFRSDLTDDFQRHQADIANILNEFELRGMQFFDDTISISNLFNLARRQQEISDAFAHEIVADVPQQIEARLQGLIDWMVEKNLRMWQGVIDYLRRERAVQQRSGLIGEIGGTFEYNRNALIESVAREAEKVVASYDREAEAQALTEEVRAAIASSTLVGAGAVGIGALLVLLLHGALFDVTGVLVAGLLAIGGLYIIPNKRRQIKRQFHQRVADLRETLAATMERQFNAELDRMITRIRDAIDPYTRFVYTQHDHLLTIQRELSDAEAEISRLQAEVERS